MIFDVNDFDFGGLGKCKDGYTYVVKIKPKPGKKDPDSTNKAHVVSVLMKIDGMLRFDEALNKVKTCHMYMVEIASGLRKNEAKKVAGMFDSDESDYEAIYVREDL